MRAFRLFLLGLCAYIVSAIFLFPAAPVIERIKPQIKPIELVGVSGKLFSGKVASVINADDLLPLQFNDVAWSLAPAALLKGGVGANIDFSGYGGSGEGQVRRQFNGDIRVSDASFTAQAKELESLLPTPVAEFTGDIAGQIDSVQVKDQLVKVVEAQLTWSKAVIVTRLYGPELTANLGEFNIDITPEDNDGHLVTLKSSGGDLDIDGTVAVSANGDYRTNILLTPSANAPRELVGVLQQRTRADGGGRFKIQHNGNMNQGT